MRHKRPLLVLLLAGLPALAACGNLESGDSDKRSASTGKQDSASTNSAKRDTTEPAATNDRSGRDPDAPGTVRVTRGGDTTTVKPSDVYCSGGPGKVRHLVAKTNHQLPLIKVEGTHFAMVKMDQRGAPDKTGRPSGVSLGNNSVAFDRAKIGSATLDGTLRCTAQGDDDDDD